MPMNEEVRKAVELGDQFAGTYERGFAVKNAWTTIRAELTRLTAIADQYDPLVVRLGEVTEKLEQANGLLRGIAGCQWFNREAPATVELIDAHLSEPRT